MKAHWLIPHASHFRGCDVGHAAQIVAQVAAKVSKKIVSNLPKKTYVEKVQTSCAKPGQDNREKGRSKGL